MNTSFLVIVGSSGLPGLSYRQRGSAAAGFGGYGGDRQFGFSPGSRCDRLWRADLFVCVLGFWLSPDGHNGFVAQAAGASDFLEVRAVLGRSLLLAVGLGCLLIVLQLPVRGWHSAF